MTFNVAKCHSMRVTRHYSHKQILHNYILITAPVNFGKCSVHKIYWHTITENMDWGQHISFITSKATKTLGFLRRNLVFVLRRLHNKL